MTWTEFRELIALAAIGLGLSAAALLCLLALLVITGAAIGGFGGAVVWSFCAVTGWCS